MAHLVVGDRGNGFSKFYMIDSFGKEVKVSFASYLGAAEQGGYANELIGGGGRIIKYRDQAFMYGYDAMLQSPTGTDAMGATIAGDVQTLYFILAGLVELSEHVSTLYHNPIRLVTALPVGLYKQEGQRTVLKHLLIGPHDVEADGIHYQFYIESVNVGLQPLAAMFSIGLREDGKVSDATLFDRPTGVMDCGTWTWNHSVMRPHPDTGKPTYIEGESFSIDYGLHKVWGLVQRDILADWPGLDGRLSLHDVDRAIQDGYFWADGEKQDISRYAAAHIRAVARDALAITRRKWGQGEHLVNHLVGGGGCPAFYPFIRQAYPRAVEIPDPFWAVARGLYRYGLLTSR